MKPSRAFQRYLGENPKFGKRLGDLAGAAKEELAAAEGFFRCGDDIQWSLGLIRDASKRLQRIEKLVTRKRKELTR